MSTPADNYIITRSTSEAERLDLQHRLVLNCQGYYLHPCIKLPSLSSNSSNSHPLRIAELATGTSIFLQELAPHLPPSTELHGFDISDRMFPPVEKRPANLHLHTADIKKPFDTKWQGYFDIVHIRFIEAAMRKEEWGPTLRNVASLLMPGGWVQWVEDDRAHSVRHAARPVARAGDAAASLEALSGGKEGFTPPKIEYLGKYTGGLMNNERADDMTYGYMNLPTLMADPETGGLEKVDRDVFVIDREDDGGDLRKEWVVMGAGATWSMLKSKEAAGGMKQGEMPTMEEVEESYGKDIAKGGHWITRVGVFVGRKKL